MDVLMQGIAFGESPRWHDARLWFSDWAAGRVYSLAADSPPDGQREGPPDGPREGTPDGGPRIEAEVESFPMCIDFLPDGRLLVVSSADRLLLRREPDGTLVPHADLAPVSTKPWNDVVVDAHGRAYVNSIGFDFGVEEPGPGIIVLVHPDATVVPVADGLAFPNGMTITPDGRTLVVAESHAQQCTAYNVAADGTLSGRRVWASTPGDHPDGICLDAAGALWYADVGNQHCVRVREGGAVLATIELDRGAFACALSTGARPRLFVVAQRWKEAGDGPAQASGQVLAFPAPAAGIRG